MKRSKEKGKGNGSGQRNGSNSDRAHLGRQPPRKSVCGHNATHNSFIVVNKYPERKKTCAESAASKCVASVEQVVRGPVYLPMQWRKRLVRRKSCPPQAAGVAKPPSPRSLTATRSNFGPVFSTKVLPASLVTYRWSPTRTGELLKAPSRR